MKTPDYNSILDSRDLEDRISDLEELELGIAEAKAALDNVESADDIEDLQNALAQAEANLAEQMKWDTELEDLRDARDEVPEWKYGATLIPDSDWVQYCQDLVEEVCDVPRNLPSYIANNIDWDGVAKELAYDYSEITLNGVCYYYRNC